MTIEERVGRLERGARRWRAAAVSAMAVCAALGLSGGVAPETRGAFSEVTLRRLSFVDENGRQWMRMGVGKRGGSYLVMLDAAGKAFLEVEAGETEMSLRRRLRVASISIRGPEGKVATVANLAHEGRPSPDGSMIWDSVAAKDFRPTE